MATNNEQSAVTAEKVSTPPVSNLTAEERKKRYAELRARIGKPRTEVIGKQGVHYFWAPKEDSNEMSKLDMLGYKIVREPNPKEVLAGKVKPSIQANGLREDGTYQLGDVILLECTEETYEFMMLDVEERHNQLARSATEDFQFEAEKTGVPTFKTDKRS